MVRAFSCGLCDVHLNDLHLLSLLFFFFFQAEDGIRDHCVTGVQTCALPICRSRAPLRLVPFCLATEYVCLAAGSKAGGPRRRRTKADRDCRAKRKQERERSEERRVGKECRSRWSPYH